jgi:hypothetical protein
VQTDSPPPRDFHVKSLNQLLDWLGAFLERVGPNAPPGFDRARETESWAAYHQQYVVLTFAGLCECLFDGDAPPLGREFVLRGDGWGDLAVTPLIRVYEVVLQVAARWGFAFTRETAYEWGQARRYSMVPIGVETPPRRSR